MLGAQGSNPGRTPAVQCWQQLQLPHGLAAVLLPAALQLLPVAAWLLQCQRQRRWLQAQQQLLLPALLRPLPQL